MFIVWNLNSVIKAWYQIQFNSLCLQFVERILSLEEKIIGENTLEQKKEEHDLNLIPG